MSSEKRDATATTIDVETHPDEIRICVRQGEVSERLYGLTNEGAVDLAAAMVFCAMLRTHDFEGPAKRFTERIEQLGKEATAKQAAAAKNAILARSQRPS